MRGGRRKTDMAVCRAGIRKEVHGEGQEEGKNEDKKER